MNGRPHGILTKFAGCKTACITPPSMNPYVSSYAAPRDDTGEASAEGPQNGKPRENWQGIVARGIRDRETGELYETCGEAARALGMSPASVKRECLKGERLEWESS